VKEVNSLGEGRGPECVASDYNMSKGFYSPD
jgi:hypothetical protein